MSLCATLLFSIIVSLDGFFAGTAYGLNKINVPPKSLLIIGAISFGCTALAIISATAAADYFPVNFLGGCLLILIGIISLRLKQPACPGQDKPLPKQISFSIGRIVINIIRKPERADFDSSNDVSAFEALFLGMALGLDNTAATFAAALNSTVPVYTPFIIFLTQINFIYLGIKMGRFFSPQSQKHLSYLPGIYFILLGLFSLA